MPADPSQAPSLTAIAGLIFGIVGTGLGIINTARSILKDRTKLKVEPVLVPIPGSNRFAFAVEVTNLSNHTITVKRVGTILQNKQKSYFNPGLIGSSKLPAKLESKDVVSFSIPPEIYVERSFKDSIAVFAETSCEKSFAAKKCKMRRGWSTVLA